MLNNLRNWLDHRTGYKRVMEALLIEHIPGGAKWRYVWGSTLLFMFVLQAVTGILLMTSYSPGDSTAWGSVYYIQYEMDFGWLIRGLHHFGSGTMVVLLGLHMLQVVIAGAHLPPRELNWWLGLVLLALILAMSLTGYLLPWDQKGYWATQVATNIAGKIPVVGEAQQKIIVGGPSYGHHTLTRFFTLHVAILPPLIVLFIILHMTVFRRHGVTVSRVTQPVDVEGEPYPQKGDGWFWPDQAFRDMVVSMIIFAVLMGLTIYGFGHPIGQPEGASFYQKIAHAGRDGHGANLDAPADPQRSYPAVPEWYFLFLFQLLKYFEGDLILIGTMVIPAGVGLLLFLLPLLGYGRIRKFGHVFGVLVVVGLLASVAVLTALAIRDDSRDEDINKEKDKAEKLAAHAVIVADAGIPAEGAVQLLRRDPRTRGRELFENQCAGCHSYKNEFDKEEYKAGDLADFGDEERIYQLLLNPAHADFFGRTKLKRMSGWIKKTFPHLTATVEQEKKLAKDDQEANKKAKVDLRELAKFLARHPRADDKDRESPEYKKRLQLFEDVGCVNCHAIAGKERGGDLPGPDLSGYGDANWLRLMVLSPHSSDRYGDRNAMPIFRDLEGPTAELTKQELAAAKENQLKEAKDDAAKKRIEDAAKLSHLSDVDRELIIRFILRDDRVVFGGSPIGGAGK